MSRPAGEVAANPVSRIGTVRLLLGIVTIASRNPSRVNTFATSILGVSNRSSAARSRSVTWQYVNIANAAATVATAGANARGGEDSKQGANIVLTTTTRGRARDPQRRQWDRG